MSVMEISHRSKTFEDLLGRAIEDVRALAGIPEHYEILTLQGGATLQFSMVPMNLLGAGASADYIDTGSWSDKAITEAKKVGVGQHRCIDQGGQVRAHSRAARAEADARRGVRAHHQQ